MFNPVEFQNNLQAFLEQKFDDLEGKRKKDKEEFQSNILKLKNTNNKSSAPTFKYKSNKLQYEFLHDLLDDIENAKDLVEAGSKKRLNKVLDDIVSSINKRQKIIRLADRSAAGWDTVNEYLPDELASDSEDDKKLRQAENRALSKRTKKFPHRRSPYPIRQQWSSTPSTSFGVPQRLRAAVSFNQSFQNQVPVALNPQKPFVHQPFLSQGAFGAGGLISQHNTSRFTTPLHVCFNC